MCTVCGCAPGEARIEGTALPAAQDAHAHAHAHGLPHSHDGDHAHPHEHDHSHDHGHEHRHDHVDYGQGPAHAHAPGISQARMVQIEQDILSKNDRLAAGNRGKLDERDVLALNLVSSPGAGKTTLLVKTLQMLQAESPDIGLAVVEGDQQTSHDAERIRSTGVRAIQINTGKGCHLDAHMVGHAIDHLDPAARSLLFIENVGNLVCPSAFDLGEAFKVVVLSVTEGEDKPMKYPDMFRVATLMVLNKVDLMPHVDFDRDKAIANARRVNPGLQVIEVSARSGEGMLQWLDWLRQARQTRIEAHAQMRSAELARLRDRMATLEAQLGTRQT